MNKKATWAVLTLLIVASVVTIAVLAMAGGVPFGGQDGPTNDSEGDANVSGTVEPSIQNARQSRVDYSVTRPLNTTQTFEQPSGELIEARYWSSGLSGGWRTVDGYTILKADDGYWRYAEREGDRLVTTDARVGIDSVPSSLPKGVQSTDPTDDDPQTVTSYANPAGATTEPVSGTYRIPTAMINFTDTTTSYTPSEFQSLLFGNDPAIATGPGSVTDYYDEASYGQLTLTGDVSGWLTADNTQSYYGSDGFGDGGSPTGAAELVKEAAQKADSQVNFSQYDNDGDCYVDQFAVIHQGGGQEVTSNTEDIWSHRWSLYSGTGSVYTTDDSSAGCNTVYVNDYVIQPEEFREYNDAMATIGVYAHEFGHGLGLPDLYDTDGSSAGIGQWGLMGSGSYGAVQRSGDAPNHMTAWSKAYLGWIDPPEVTLGESVTDATLADVAGTNDYYKVLNEANNSEGEYFYIANRQKVGFDQGLPGDGLLITHIDRSKITDENCIFSNDCNDDEDNKLVDIEAADGNGDLDSGTNRGDSGDPWTETTGDFNDTSTPSSKYNNGTTSNVTVGSITFSSGTATADISAGTQTTQVTLLDEQWNATLDGRAQYATPAVSSNRVFVAGLGPNVTALDRSTGTVDWTIERAGSLADSSPVLASGTVYVGSGGGKVYAIDASTGDEVWNYTTDSAVVSTPAVSGGTVYIGSNDGTVVALDASNGDEQWAHEAGTAVLSTIELGTDRVYVTMNNGTVLALNDSNGNEVWSRDVGSDLGHSSPTYADGTVYVAGDQVFALNATDGQIEWSTSTYSGTAGSSPTINGSTLYVGSANGTVHALQTSDGSGVWKYDAGATVASTPAVASDRVVFGDDAGTVHLLDAGSGAVEKTVTMADRARSSPVVVSGTVYVGTDGGVYVALANIEQ